MTIENKQKLEKVIIIVNTSKKESLSLSDKIKDFLHEKNIVSTVIDFCGQGETIPSKELSDCDLVITLGGDGTVLFAARNCAEYDIPIFPVNLGQFGFMAPVQQDEWKIELDSYLEGTACFQYRSMLKASLYRNNQFVYSSLGLNDVVVGAKHISHTVALDLFYNDAHLCKLKSDGVIVSTATGSTAYSASAGGPIVDPVIDALIMTPINSFSLSSRPIVLSPDGEIKLNMLPGRTKMLCMIVDGQEPVDIVAGDTIQITTYEKKVKLIHSTQGKFYDALRSKLNWRGEPYAGRIND